MATLIEAFCLFVSFFLFVFCPPQSIQKVWGGHFYRSFLKADRTFSYHKFQTNTKASCWKKHQIGALLSLSVFGLQTPSLVQVCILIIQFVINFPVIIITLKGVNNPLPFLRCLLSPVKQLTNDIIQNYQFASIVDWGIARRHPSGDHGIMKQGVFSVYPVSVRSPHGPRHLFRSLPIPNSSTL